MKYFYLLILITTLSSLGATPPAPPSTNILWSVSNLLYHFQFNGSGPPGAFTNKITILTNGMYLVGTNTLYSITYGDQAGNAFIITSSNNATRFFNQLNLGAAASPYTAEFLVLSNNQPAIDRAWIYTSYGFPSNPPALGHPRFPYCIYATNYISMNGVIGMTTNLPVAGLTNTGVAAGGYKTNLMQFSGGILTNVINNY